MGRKYAELGFKIGLKFVHRMNSVEMKQWLYEVYR